MSGTFVNIGSLSRYNGEIQALSRALAQSVFAGSAAAYSTRIPQGSTYSGPLIRVRRSSDNAEQDIGAAGAQVAQNRNFASTANWSLGANVSIPGGSLVCGGGVTFIAGQNMGLVTGRVYNVVFTVNKTGATAVASIRVSTGTSTTSEGGGIKVLATDPPNGLQVWRTQITATGPCFCFASHAATFSGSVYFVSVQEASPQSSQDRWLDESALMNFVGVTNFPGYVQTTDSADIPGASITAITGFMGGGYVGGQIALAASTATFPITTSGSFWFGIVEGEFTKAVQLVITFTGAAYKIRVTAASFISGNQLANISQAATWSPQSIATSASTVGYGLVNLTFGTVNSAFVTTWYDQSGNGRNAVQATASAQPRIVNAGVTDLLNNKPALYPGAAGTPATFVLPAISAPAFSAVINTSGAVPSLGGLFGCVTDNGARRAITQGLGWRAVGPVAGDYAAATDWQVNGSTAVTTIDGVPGVSNPTGVDTVLSVQNGTTEALARLFASYVTPLRFYAGWCGEVIFFSSNFTTAAYRQTLERSQGVAFGTPFFIFNGSGIADLTSALALTAGATNTIDSNSTQTYSGVISGTGAGLVINANTGSLTLSGASTFTATPITIASGTVVYASLQPAYGWGGPNITAVSSGATLSLPAGGFAVWKSTITLNGGTLRNDQATDACVNWVGVSITLNGGRITSKNGLAGPANDGGFGNFLFNAITVTVNADTLYDATTWAVANGAAFNIAAGVTFTISSTNPSGSAGTSTKSGAGRLLLTGINTSAVAWTVSAGTFEITGNSSGYSPTVAAGAAVSAGASATGRVGALTFSALASKLLVSAISTTSTNKLTCTTLTAASGFTIDVAGTLNAGTYPVLVSTTGTPTPTLGTNSSGRAITFAWSGQTLNMTAV